MELVELRDGDAARTYLLQGLWLQRVLRPTAASVKPALEIALEIAAGGHPLPPVGFVADLAAVALGTDRGRAAKDFPDVPGWPHALARNYEDHLLGKVYADWTFERAADALRRYPEADRPRGVAFVVRQLRERGRLGGVELSPAVVRGLLAQPPDQVLTAGYDSLAADGPMPLLVAHYEWLVSVARRMAEVLGPEDVIALEQRTALADMGQYVAHRQILQLTARFEERLPARPVRPLAGRKEVPTKVTDDDQYPVGGYSSISTKGSIESLLHSQLAFMETDDADRPDMFDVKFVRDELFYYSRDENQFLRRRRVFAFVFDPGLTAARFKDGDLPAQRIVLALALVLTLVRRLTDWLTADALRFELLFVVPPGKPNPLADEAELLALLLREPIARGAAAVKTVDTLAQAAAECAGLSRMNQVHCLLLSAAPVAFAPDGAVAAALTVSGPRPPLTDGHGRPVAFAADDAFDQWIEAAVRVLQLWV